VPDEAEPDEVVSSGPSSFFESGAGGPATEEVAGRPQQAAADAAEEGPKDIAPAPWEPEAPGTGGEDEFALPPGRARKRPPTRRRSGGMRDVVVGGPRFIIPLILIAGLATLIISIFFTRLSDVHWGFWFFLVIFIVAAQFDLQVRGGGRINLGLAPLLAALMSIPTIQVVWIYLFGTIAELIVRLLGGEVTRDEMIVMLLDYSGVGIMALIFHGIVVGLPKKPMFLGNFWPGLIAAVAIAAAAYFFVQILGMAFELSQEGQLPAAVYLKSSLRKAWIPCTGISLVGILMGLVYVGIGMWSMLFVLPLLLVLRYAYNRIAATDQYLLETIRTLSAIPEETGRVASGHTERVAVLSAAVARELGLSPDDVNQVEYAAYLHDMGTITRWREPGAEQQQLMEVEGVISGGGDMIARVPYLDVASEILSGREGLRDRVEDAGKRRSASMGAGILRAVDDFESLVQGREEREPLSESDALVEMNLERGTRYDSKVLRAIARVIARMPREGLLESAEGSTESSPFWRDEEG